MHGICISLNEEGRAESISRGSHRNCQREGGTNSTVYTGSISFFSPATSWTSSSWPQRRRRFRPKSINTNPRVVDAAVGLEKRSTVLVFYVCLFGAADWHTVYSRVHNSLSIE